MIFHHLNFFSISSIIVFLSCIVSIFFLFFSNYRMHIKRMWIFFSAYTGLWGFGAMVLFSTNDPNKALFFSRFINILQPILAVTFLDFVRSFTRRFYIKIKYFYISSFVLIFLGIFSIDQFIRSCNFIQGKFYYPRAERLFIFYVIYFVSIIFYGLILLLCEVNRTKNLVKINQTKYILVGFLIGFFGSFTTFFHLFNINIHPYGMILIPLYIVIPMYAIINYNLMEIDIAWRKISQKICSFLIYILSIFMIVFSVYKKNIILGIVFITVSSFLYYKKQKVDKFFYFLFLGKYKKILDQLRLIKIKNILDKNVILDILINKIPKELNIKTAIYYELSGEVFKIIKFNVNSFRKFEIPVNSKLVKNFINTKKYIYSPNILINKKNINLIFEMKKFGIEYCYPFFIDGTLKSFLVYNRKGFIFNKEELSLLTNIIKDAELEMNTLLRINVKTNEVLNQYKTNQRIFFLEEIERLDEIQEIDSLCKKSEKLINRILKTNTASIYLYDIDKNIYYCETDNTKNLSLEKNTSFFEYIKYRKDILFYNEVHNWVKQIKSKELEISNKIMEQIKSEIIIPFVDEKNLIGFISLGKKIDTEEIYSQDDYFMLKVIANKIKNRLFHIFSLKKANYDALTRLPNERFMKVRLSDEIVKSSNNSRIFAVGIFDVDDFKGINDNFGHEEGDVTLRTIAEVVLSLIRPSDEIFRKGGDEFILLLRDIDKENLETFAKRFDKSFKEHPKIKKLEEKYKRRVSISIGIFLYFPSTKVDQYSILEIDNIIHFLIKSADQALYNAKKNGKARIKIFNNLADSNEKIEIL